MGMRIWVYGHIYTFCVLSCFAFKHIDCCQYFLLIMNDNFTEFYWYVVDMCIIKYKNVVCVDLSAVVDVTVRHWCCWRWCCYYGDRQRCWSHRVRIWCWQYKYQYNCDICRYWSVSLPLYSTTQSNQRVSVSSVKRAVVYVEYFPFSAVCQVGVCNLLRSNVIRCTCAYSVLLNCHIYCEA